MLLDPGSATQRKRPSGLHAVEVGKIIGGKDWMNGLRVPDAASLL